MEPLRSATDMIYAVGIEDTAIGHPLRGGQELDEYRLTGHWDCWRADLDRVSATGVTAFRYGLPWHRLNPAPGQFDWRLSDEIFQYIQDKVPARLILDLVHYGTPNWLGGSFADPGFPQALADFAAAVASRYRGVVPAYTPLNEPLVTASFCGLRGIWPPYMTGDEGWACIVVSVARAVQAATRALRQADPDAEVVHVEAVQAYITEDPSLKGEVSEWEERARLPLRLVLGQVRQGDRDWSWLSGHGADAAVLRGLSGEAGAPDVLGLNYYPALSSRELVRLDGATVHVAIDAGFDPLGEELARCSSAYQLPVMVTETGLEGPPAAKISWLDALVAGLSRLRSQGSPVLGLTWWPLFDFVDWSWASGGAVVEEFYWREHPGAVPQPVPPPGRPGGAVEPFLRRMGLYELGGGADGPLSRVPTPALGHFIRYANNSAGGLPAAGTDPVES